MEPNNEKRSACRMDIYAPPVKGGKLLSSKNKRMTLRQAREKILETSRKGQVCVITWEGVKCGGKA